MAYVDLEQTNPSYRVIFGNHKVETTTEQLPDSCTAILIEGMFRDPKNLFSGFTGGFIRQYSSVLEAARDRNIPLVMAESTFNTGVNPMLGLLLQSLFFPPAYISTFIGLQLGNYNGGIDRNGLLFKVLDKLEASQELLPAHSGAFRLRNLVMAQKAETFTDLQSRQGIQAPSIAIVAGAHHTGLVRALEMPEEERIGAILGHKKLGEYYRPELFHQGYYGQPNRRRNRWNVKEFTEPRLQLARVGK